MQPTFPVNFFLHFEQPCLDECDKKPHVRLDAGISHATAISETLTITPSLC